MQSLHTTNVPQHSNTGSSATPHGMVDGYAQSGGAAGLVMCARLAPLHHLGAFPVQSPHSQLAVATFSTCNHATVGMLLLP
jgi:hypothetical protein